MIYWGYVNKPKKEPVTVPAESPEKYKNMEKAAKTVGIGVGAGVGGYIIYRAMYLSP